MPTFKTVTAVLAISLSLVTGSSAQNVTAKSDPKIQPEFDIVQATITTEANWLTFKMQVSGKIGAAKPAPGGKLEGAKVFSYVWPTSLDSSVAGFDAKQGILALAVAAHPDFDDTPLFDENSDGKYDNDGGLWHSHWVVLVKDPGCGGGLKVKDIPKGAKPKLPRTWPGLPILIDSPGYSPVIDASTVSVRVPFRATGALKGMKFDGVTSGLRVGATPHDKLLCVTDVFKVGSGNLSLPGRVQ